MNKPPLRSVMLAGTGSNVGKSLLVAGLCRIFLQDGYHPAPFKAQNMALNSFVTPDGLEIGRAQAVQAEAAGIPCEADMNPILLKPSSDHTSQIVLMGKPIGNMKASEYFRNEGRESLRQVVAESFQSLKQRFNPIVMEGAGSIAEINLKESDLVNMPMARQADADVFLVADIDRGGVFASVYGSIMLQSETDRKRIKGIIINKFRGDISLFEEGRRMMENLCGVPVLGVMPYMSDLHIEEEDSVILGGKNHHIMKGKVNVAVVLLPHISNFTDFNVLEHDDRVNLFYTSQPEELMQSDIVILPGSKATLADLLELHQTGLAEAILRSRREGHTIVGICGGYQMMGQEITDPKGIEGQLRTLPGLRLLPTRTIIGTKKTTRQTQFKFLNYDTPCQGYEIHMGTTESEHPSPMNHCENGTEEGYYLDNHCFGTYMHGIFDNSVAVEHLLQPYLKEQTKASFDYKAYRNQQYELLAEEMRKNIDIPQIYRILGEC